MADAVLDGRGQRESAMAEQATADAEAAAADEASRTVRPADLRKPQRPAETPSANGVDRRRLDELAAAARAGCMHIGRRDFVYRQIRRRSEQWQ